MPGSNAILKGLLLLAVGAAVADVNNTNVNVNVNEVDALKLQGPFGFLKNLPRVELTRVPGAGAAALGKVAGIVSGAEWKRKAEWQRERDLAAAWRQRNHAAVQAARNGDPVLAELRNLTTMIQQGDAFALKHQSELRAKINSGKTAAVAKYELMAKLDRLTPTNAGFFARGVWSASDYGSSGSRAGSLRGSPVSSRTPSPNSSRPVSPNGSDAGDVAPTRFVPLAGVRLRGSSQSPSPSLARPVARSVASSQGSGSSAWSHKSTAQMYPRDAPRARGSSVPATANLASNISNYGPLAGAGRRAHLLDHGYAWGQH